MLTESPSPEYPSESDETITASAVDPMLARQHIQHIPGTDFEQYVARILPQFRNTKRELNRLAEMARPIGGIGSFLVRESISR